MKIADLNSVHIFLIHTQRLKTFTRALSLSPAISGNNSSLGLVANAESDLQPLALGPSHIVFVCWRGPVHIKKKIISHQA